MVRCMTSRDWVPSGTYESIRADADRTLSDMEYRGRTRTEYRIHAALHRNALDKHVSTTRELGGRCAECSQAWPCGSIAGIFAPD